MSQTLQIDRLRGAVTLQRLAEAEQLQAIADLAGEHDWTTTDELDVVGERAVRVGADGTPLVGEFLPLEVAATTGTSVESATWLIRDVLNLHCRLPGLWRAVLAGQVPARQAFALVQLTSRYDLTHAQAAGVDDRLRAKYGRVGWPRVMRLARGLIGQVAADKVEAAAEAARQARFVKLSGTGEPVVTEVWARLDAVDAQQLEASIQAIAKTLKAQGDGDELDVRRAKALGILATPGRALAMLQGRDDDRYVPRTKVYLHLTPAMLTGNCRCGGLDRLDQRDADPGVRRDDEDRRDDADGPGLDQREPGVQPVARSETLGPITKNQLTDLFGTTRIHITPVIHAGDDPAVDSYEIPDRVREHITLRDVVEPFPYSTRSARGLDLDHTVPYVEGGKGQTRPSNLGPLRRRLHRAKTVGRWHLKQPRAGVFWWQSPTGQRYRVTPHRHHRPARSLPPRTRRTLATRHPRTPLSDRPCFVGAA